MSVVQSFCSSSCGSPVGSPHGLLLRPNSSTHSCFTYSNYMPYYTMALDEVDVNCGQQRRTREVDGTTSRTSAASCSSCSHVRTGRVRTLSTTQEQKSTTFSERAAHTYSNMTLDRQVRHVNASAMPTTVPVLSHTLQHQENNTPALSDEVLQDVQAKEVRENMLPRRVTDKRTARLERGVERINDNTCGELPRRNVARAHAAQQAALFLCTRYRS